MPTVSEPAEVIRRVVAGVSRLISGRLTDEEVQAQLDELASLYAEDTDVRHPFAPLGDVPLRTRAALRRHFASSRARNGGAERFEAIGRIHHTPDPEVVIYEFNYVGSANGRPFTLPCIFVARVRDGLIVESRDYGDHLGLARAFGQYDELLMALSNQSGRDVHAM